MDFDLVERINDIYGSQAKCAEAMNWDRRTLNKILRKKREARVSEVNALAKAARCSVNEVVYFLCPKSHQTGNK